MPSRLPLLKVSALSVLLVPGYALAQEPVSQIGIKGSYSEQTFDSDIEAIDDSTGRMPKVGLFYNFGNKLTAESGFIYQAGIEASYGERDDNEVRDARAEIDLGLRGALDNNLYADLIVGAGYDWTRYEPDAGDGLETRMTNKSPFAKAAVALGHQGPTVGTRLEVGTRYSIDGRTNFRVEDVGSETLDMKNQANPYAELSFLWNQREGAMPVSASVYYERKNYALDDSELLSDNTRLKSEEVGLRLGMLF
ncbi:MAG: outer membrane beta-barrel protein [Pseudomonas sp.]